MHPAEDQHISTDTGGVGGPKDRKASGSQVDDTGIEHNRLSCGTPNRRLSLFWRMECGQVAGYSPIIDSWASHVCGTTSGRIKTTTARSFPLPQPPHQSWVSLLSQQPSRHRITRLLFLSSISQSRAVLFPFIDKYCTRSSFGRFIVSCFTFPIPTFSDPRIP
ncbi:hypothetical protein BJV74DRAFT_305143 [Russula compacta]|nr:hypothetical protein BJV74DRAFT_305143 [Russula compacta]